MLDPQRSQRSQSVCTGSALCVLLCLRRNCHRRSSKWQQVPRGGHHKDEQHHRPLCTYCSDLSLFHRFGITVFWTDTTWRVEAGWAVLPILLLLSMVIVPTISACLACKAISSQKRPSDLREWSKPTKLNTIPTRPIKLTTIPTRSVINLTRSAKNPKRVSKSQPGQPGSLQSQPSKHHQHHPQQRPGTSPQHECTSPIYFLRYGELDKTISGWLLIQLHSVSITFFCFF